MREPPRWLLFVVDVQYDIEMWCACWTPNIVENDLMRKPLSQKMRQVDPKDLTIVRHCCAVFYRNVVRMDCPLLCLHTLVRCPHKCVNCWYSTESIHLVSVTVFILWIHLCLNTLVRCPHKCILDGNEGCHADKGASRRKHIEVAWPYLFDVYSQRRSLQAGMEACYIQFLLTRDSSSQRKICFVIILWQLLTQWVSAP